MCRLFASKTLIDHGVRQSLTYLAALLPLAWLCAVPGRAEAEAETSAGVERGRIDRILDVPYALPAAASEGPTLELVRQDYEQLETGRSVIKTPLVIGQKTFARGLGSHSVGQIRVRSPWPIKRFAASIGVDNNERTQGKRGSVVFAVAAGGKQVYRSKIVRAGQQPQQLDLELPGVNTLDLLVGDAGDGPGWDHADWAQARIVTADGKTFWLDELKRDGFRRTRYPFSFIYGGRHSDELLPGWDRQQQSEKLEEGRTRTVTIWTDPQTGLRVEWQVTRFDDYPAVEWLLYFENTGPGDTPIIEDVQALSLALEEPLAEGGPYRLHRTRGAPSNPTDFEPAVVTVGGDGPQVLSGGGGRSSNRDFPFMKIETGQGSLIVAVGWSGQWRTRLGCPDGRRLGVTAGLERTHFRLHRSERVRSPRILMLHTTGDTRRCNARFRRLIYHHYAARREGRRLLPTLYCNTCFTRGGHWLNECNAANQISLIRAYAPLGLEALLTDAGWFEGGWPDGAGNWTPRKDAYPDGMGPVAAAAKAEGMIYGLWFEVERVVAGTRLHREHSQWLLKSTDGPQKWYLLNFALPEVREHALGIVKGLMDLPGFRVYRQDFNMDPLPYWRHSDAADRQGISEMKYVEGLYRYWERIAETWPDSLRIECSSGGRRIDLETVMRMHVHQKSDYWFRDDVDQASIWGLSQYLPNQVFMAPLNRLDDYSFHSTIASSLCLGWIADAEDFDRRRAKTLVDRYRRVRHLLVGQWYPLLPYTRDRRRWMASQYHRADLDEGMVLAFRHSASPQATVKLSLAGLRPQATYELFFHSRDRTLRATGAELMSRLPMTIPRRRQSELIVYRAVRK